MSRPGAHKARNAGGQENRVISKMDAEKELINRASKEELRALGILFGDIKPTAKYSREWAIDTVCNMTIGNSEIALALSSIGLFETARKDPVKGLALLIKCAPVLNYLVPKKQPRKREEKDQTPSVTFNLNFDGAEKPEDED